jgi:energy-converting hydrogenase Eha subunit A
METSTTLECATEAVVKAQPFARTQLLMQKHSPEILVGMGLTSMVVGTVLACRATLKAPAASEKIRDAFAEIKAEREELAEEIYSKKAYRLDLVRTTRDAAWSFTKIYAIPTAVIGLGVYSVIKGHGITIKRNAALSATLTMVTTGYKEYRQRVADKFGADAEADVYLNRREETSEETTVGADGKEKVKKSKKIAVDIPDHSMYAKFFDEGNPNWSPSAEQNRMWLQCKQGWMNDTLRARGHVFLNEVYDELGFERTQQGQVMGWVIGNTEGDNFIDFGIFNQDSERARRFVNGDEASIILDFNVDGVVLDLI